MVSVVVFDVLGVLTGEYKLFLEKERFQRLLQKMKKKGLHICVLSNSGAYLSGYHKDLKEFLDTYTDAQFFLAATDICKPNKEAFLRVLHHYIVAPEECLFVDDGRDNIEGANQLGFKTHLHRDITKTLDELEKVI